MKPIPRKVTVPAAALSAAVILFAPAAVMLWPVAPSAASYAAPAPLTLAAPGGGYSPAARERLLALAATLPATVPADSAPAPAAQEVCFEQWSMDTTDPAAQIVVHRTQIRRNPDGSGHTVVTTGGVAHRTEYATDGLPALIPQPLATDPADLYRQLAEYHEPPSNGPHVMARSIAALPLHYRLTPTQTRAALTVLADVAQLRYAGTATDRLGRTGAVYTVDSQRHDVGGQTRDLLVIAEDGQLLEHDVIALIPPDRSPITPGTVTAYTVTCLLGQ